MIFEKFYDVNNVFFGWHCVICGEILDAVILLHRLSQDADLHIPEEEQQVMILLKKYLNAKTKDSKGGGGGDWKEENSLQEEEKSYPDWALAIPLVRLLERIAWELKKVPGFFLAIFCNTL